jgi:hypothetical protein
MNMAGLYILDPKGEPIPCPDVLKWGHWFQNAKRHVGWTKIKRGIYVSTVFLGIDYAWDEGQPVLWETMVFGLKGGDLQDRCGGSREQAEAMHNKMVERMKLETK